MIGSSSVSRPRRLSRAVSSSSFSLTLSQLQEPSRPSTAFKLSTPRPVAELDRADGTITFRFHARDAHIVLSPGTRGPIPFRLVIDGEPPGPSHGVDVDDDGNGVLRDARMYQLVRQHGTVQARTLKTTFLEPGAEAYAFTFG
jgi:Thioredoxin like C-terminal domain